MLNKKNIQLEADFLENLKDLCVAYEQISVMKMKEIKDKVFYTRGFYSQLDKVYVRLKKTYHRQVETLFKKHKIKDMQKMLLLGKSKKRAIVFIAANNRFYGDILNKVFSLFLKDAKNSNDDIIIIGSLGKSMYDNLGPGKDYQYFAVGDEISITLENLRSIIEKLGNYSKVDVYYGQYESFFNQKAVSVNITGDLSEKKDITNEKENFYYFEPGLEEILVFFETQIFASLFKQTVYESQLARYASRVGAMEEALVAVDKRKVRNIREKRKLVNFIAEKKQRERVSQFFLRRNYQ